MAQFIKRRVCLNSWLMAAASILVTASASADNAALPTAPDLPTYQWFASTDKKHQNEDYLLLKPGETRKIALSAGVIERFWWTALEPERIEVALLQKDGKRHVISGDSRYLHEKAFAFHQPNTPPEGLSRVWPIQKNFSAFTVTNRGNDPEGNKFFYQVTIRPQSQASSPKPKLGTALRNTQRIELAAGAEKAIELKGAGQVENIELALQKPDDLQALRLRAAWDGEAANAIDAPLAALIGVFDGGKKVASTTFVFDGKSAVLKWPMPFARGAKITFVNISSAPITFESNIVGIQLKTAPPYRFHAVYGSARSELKKPVSMLDVSGKGAFCGLNLSIEPAPDSRRRTFAFLEGNETLVADGIKYEGTGTEDFFSSAWYFPKKEFSFPFHGMTFKSEMPPRVCAYRLMIPDALPFKNSLRFDFEHGKGNNSNDLVYRWVAFWYAEPAAKFTVKDGLRNGKTGPEAVPEDSLMANIPHIPLILTALLSAFIVGVGGALLLRRARK